MGSNPFPEEESGGELAHSAMVVSKRLLADGCVPGWEGWGVWGQVALLQPQVPEILPEPDQWEPSTINSGVSAASRQCRGGRRSTGQIDIGYFRR